MMEPLKTRVKVLNEEVIKLVADLRESEQKAVATKQMERDAKLTQQEGEDKLKQRQEEMDEERHAVEEDLSKQFKVGFKK